MCSFSFVQKPQEAKNGQGNLWYVYFILYITPSLGHIVEISDKGADMKPEKVFFKPVNM